MWLAITQAPEHGIQQASLTHTCYQTFFNALQQDVWSVQEGHDIKNTTLLRWLSIAGSELHKAAKP